jgi:hypothetical protein
MRTIVFALGLALAVGATALAVLCCFAPAGMLAFWALFLLGGIAIERWRYQRLDSNPPGADWQQTGERFIDPETGRLVTVFIRPATGERRYITADQTANATG